MSNFIVEFTESIINTFTIIFFSTKNTFQIEIVTACTLWLQINLHLSDEKDKDEYMANL